MFEKMFELKLYDISTYSSTIKRGICHWLCYSWCPASGSWCSSKFSLHKSNKTNIDYQFNYVSGLSIKTEEQEYILKTPSTISFPHSLITVQWIIVNTYTKFRSCYNISCWNKEEFWTCGHDNMIRLYNFQGELVKSI